MNTKSIDFESGSSQYGYISHADQTGLNPTSTISIEAWVNLESEATEPHIVSKWYTSGNRSYRVFYYDDRIYVDYSGDGTNANSYKTTDAVISTGEWIYVAVTIASATGTVKIYIDGSEVSVTTVSNTGQTSIYYSSADFCVGTYNSPGSTAKYWDGLIDEVRFWADIRTAEEIANYRNVELTGTETDLRGYWKFNDDATDETANGNDLTLVNSPVYSTDVPFSGGVSRRGGFMVFF